MEFDATFWSAVAFVLLMLGFGYLGVHKKLAEALDHRATRIKGELDDARRLREEAQKLVAEYRAKRDSAVKEAGEIIDNAKSEAERIAAEAKTRMEDFVTRRTKMAEAKIAQAEAQALADVRAAAAEAAVAAAAKVLSETVKGQTAETLLTQGIAEVRQKLN
jgi:F-type H+-transporting ATPase subunit b